MGRKGMHVGYWWESQKERDHQVNQYIGGWIIGFTEIGWGGVG
jgi:hypothetical protein